MKRGSLLVLTAGFCGLAAVTAMAAAQSPAQPSHRTVAPAADAGVTTCADAGTAVGYRSTVGAAQRSVAFAGQHLLLAAENAPGERPAELVNGVSASADGATVAMVVDAKGADRLVLSTDAGASWSTIAHGPDLAYPAVSPSGGRVAWTADGALTVATAADKWRPAGTDTSTVVTGRTYVQYPRFVDEDRLVLSLQVPVAGVAEDFAALADVWLLDLRSTAWTRLTAGKADADRWSVATTPLMRPDGTVLYVLMTGLGSGSDADLRTELRRVAPDGTDQALTALPHRWGIVAAAADGSLLFNGPDERSRWQLVSAAPTGERTVLGCGRAAWAPPLNHDPDRG